MLRGLYTGASGMVVQMNRMDVISNNLANVDTTGYKKDTAIQKAFPEMLLQRMNDNGVYTFPLGSVDTAPMVGRLGTGVEQNEVYSDFTQGSLKETSNPFDMALENEGFFVIDTPAGERFTRDGSFTIDPSGYLVTSEGHPVLGQNGPIQLKLNNFTVDKQGQIFQNAEFADDPDRLVSMQENEWNETELIDTLRVVDFPHTRYLEKQGGSLWRASEVSGSSFEITGTERPGVLQGFIEGSNVNSVTEMVQMISVNRAYEANQKAITSHDEITGKLINQAAQY